MLYSMGYETSTVGITQARAVTAGEEKAGGDERINELK